MGDYRTDFHDTIGDDLRAFKHVLAVAPPALPIFVVFPNRGNWLASFIRLVAV